MSSSRLDWSPLSAVRTGIHWTLILDMHTLLALLHLHVRHHYYSQLSGTLDHHNWESVDLETQLKAPFGNEVVSLYPCIAWCMRMSCSVLLCNMRANFRP